MRNYYYDPTTSENVQEKSDQKRAGLVTISEGKQKRKSWIWIVSLWGMSLPLIPLLYMQQTLYDIFRNYLVPHISKPRKKEKSDSIFRIPRKTHFLIFFSPAVDWNTTASSKKKTIQFLHFFFWHNLHINRTISHHLNLKGIINTHTHKQYNTIPPTIWVSFTPWLTLVATTALP